MCKADDAHENTVPFPSMNLERLPIAAKVALGGTMVIIAVVIGALALMSWHLAAAMRTDAERALRERTDVIAKMIAAFDHSGRTEAERVHAIFAADFKNPFKLGSERTKVGAVDVPALLHDGKNVALDFTAVDAFTRTTGGVATVFVRSGDDFVRVSTSLKNEKGERAIGTLLGKQHPAYGSVMKGATYVGRAVLFGKPYMTKYAPIIEGSDVIGLLFVGADISEWVAALRSVIDTTRVGDTGFVYAIDARDGPGQGTLVIHPSKAGFRLADQHDAAADAFVKEVVATKSGIHRSPWNTRTQSNVDADDRVAVYSHAPEWNWIIVADVPRAELDRLARETTVPIGVGGILAAALLCAVLWWLARRLVGEPLVELGSTIRGLADCDLTVAVRARRADEVGKLTESIGELQQRLREVIGTIVVAAGAVNTSASDLAAGNHDRSQRTEEQASSLEQTTSSMEQLTGSVRQNAEDARRANELATAAAEIAVRGGGAVADVVQTMGGISQSSKKIADIIGVIDGIAFQTNILALNAAVEAARAGDHGRGFAVVAGEVRNLAQRSATAAKEIKTLIDDSVGKVDSGAALVHQAGTTMEEVVAAIKRLTDIMGRISAASQEQSTGIQQVGEAIVRMDRVTQQNAAAVGQEEAATQDLLRQAQTLVQAVAVFTIDADATASERPAARDTASMQHERARAMRPSAGARLAARHRDVVNG